LTMVGQSRMNGDIAMAPSWSRGKGLGHRRCVAKTGKD
jgi:hypothetical protein